MARSGTKYDTLALALAKGKSVMRAATEAGVSKRSAFRQLTDSAFRQRVAELRAGMVNRAMGIMATGMSHAAVTLRKLLKAENESVRLGACRAMLELGSKLRDSVELEERFAELESRVGGKIHG